VVILEPIAAEHPAFPYARRDLAKALQLVGALRASQGDAASARTMLMRARELWFLLLDETPGHDEYAAERDENAKLLAELPAASG
jgi:hypothetical protein